ncbi:MAG: BolA family transcriptional regulator [Alphaproteobacteria bacterium]|nr:BolA family transcriptional regulator [Alphaproteobacteria bacterium]
MALAEEIKTRVIEAMAPEVIEVINESHKHAGHAGDNGTGESHFRIIVVSARFENCARLARHRMINEALEPVFKKGLHALSIQAFSPSEYK